MDFTLDDEQQAIHDLTAQILGDLSTHERLKDLAAADDHVDCDAWAALAEAGVVGASIPEAHGGAGLGFLATAMAMQVAGAHASPIPLLSTIVMGAMPISEFGTEAQQAAWLPQIADGSLVVAAAFHEPGTTPTDPLTTARADDGGPFTPKRPMTLESYESFSRKHLDAARERLETDFVTRTCALCVDLEETTRDHAMSAELKLRLLRARVASGEAVPDKVLALAAHDDSNKPRSRKRRKRSRPALLSTSRSGRRVVFFVSFCLTRRWATASMRKLAKNQVNYGRR